MSTATSIEWTTATWNPTTGCDRTSPGCDHCYALTMAKRLKAMGSPRYQRDGDPGTSGPGFRVTLHHDQLALPLHWRKPRRIFVNSMSDLFHYQVPDVFRLDVWATMAASSRHQYQILTKRPQAMAQFCRRLRWWLHGDPYLIGSPTLRTRSLDCEPLPNVWLGTSIESDRYTFRADHLRQTPAAVRFLSLEPLLGPLPSLDLTGIDWVIVGGESGPGARPMHPEWVRRIRNRCVAARIPLFFKQWGAWAPGLADDPGPYHEWDDGQIMARLGKKVAGRHLDGRTWDEMPG